MKFCLQLTILDESDQLQHNHTVLKLFWVAMTLHERVIEKLSLVKTQVTLYPGPNLIWSHQSTGFPIDYRQIMLKSQRQCQQLQRILSGVHRKLQKRIGLNLFDSTTTSTSQKAPQYIILCLRSVLQLQFFVNDSLTVRGTTNYYPSNKGCHYIHVVALLCCNITLADHSPLVCTYAKIPEQDVTHGN